MIFVTGDCHGDYRKLSSAAFREQKEMDRQDFVIVCGDFGYWDRSRQEEYWMDWLAQKDFTLLFVDGNHENYDLLAEFPVQMWHGDKVQMIRENVIHLMRGQMFNLQGRRFFTFGGARSHDIVDGILEPDDPELRVKVKRLEGAGALYRINHLTWWKEEMPSEQEYEEGRSCLEQNGWKCDYILSHCAPSSVQAQLSCGRFDTDPLTVYLEEIKNRCEYRKWFFGHYHEDELVDDRHMVLYRGIERVL
ncbi:metallophosphoesterase family protein [Enterocloster lavalensis]|uniref:Calcineurin-like phosphoesterase n=1 Tax=Enterocloster lavalensis TaxID=460384 RepID=A0A1I0ECX9_9FIRM|nr:metallophosphoesterase [Enterocloster lavalensis]SET42911.1 Calcineurin-like phosphoesterase [Enterocloster lavalensis]